MTLRRLLNVTYHLAIADMNPAEKAQFDHLVGSDEERAQQQADALGMVMGMFG